MADYSRNRGNILFIILIAVALFAALSFAVTSSTRNSGKESGNEKLDLTAAQILQYSALLESSVMRMRMSAGCSDTQISFATPSMPQYDNPSAPATGQCNVFGSGGGAYSPHGIIHSGLSAESFFCGAVKVDSIGTEEPELLFRIPITSAALCSKINEKLGLTAAGAAPPVSSVWTNTSCYFTGSYATTGHVIAGAMKSRLAGCYQIHTSSPNDFIFYDVLLAR